MGDFIMLNPNLASIRLQKRDDEFQGHALAGAASPENAKGFARANVERHIAQNLFCAKRLRHVIEDNCGSAHIRNSGIDHRALSGNMKKMNLIKRTSIRMISNDETTTLLVAARPTPAAPSLVV